MEMTHQQERERVISASNSFMQEVKEVIRKHGVHGAVIAWLDDDLAEPQKGPLSGISMLCHGCAYCGITAAAVGLAQLKDEERQMFIQVYRGTLARRGKMDVIHIASDEMETVQ